MVDAREVVYMELEDAVENGNLDLVKKLALDKYCDLRENNDHMLKLATSKGHLDIVKYLVSCGCDLNNLSDGDIIGCMVRVVVNGGIAILASLTTLYDKYKISDRMPIMDPFAVEKFLDFFEGPNVIQTIFSDTKKYSQIYAHIQMCIPKRRRYAFSKKYPQIVANQYKRILLSKNLIKIKLLNHTLKPKTLAMQMLYF
jgi:hypothetical protein